MNRKSFLHSAGLLATGAIISFEKAFAAPAGNDALWIELINYARWCPSPHNVQPWKMKIISKTEAHLYYDPQRVPGVVDDRTSFTIAGLGMFIECLSIAALSKGYELTAIHEAEPQLDNTSQVLRPFASLQLGPTSLRAIIDPELIKKRRTSRLHYDGGPVSKDMLDSLKKIAGSYGHRLSTTSDEAIINEIICLNTETILERFGDRPAMDEMRHWVRCTDAEAAKKKDGLWSKANASSPKLMHNFFFHHHRFDHGWKKMATRSLLNKSMRGTRDMAWLSGPFGQRTDWVKAGAMLQQLWLEMTRQGLYMHPLGTVITTPSAKQIFLEKTRATEDENIVWFLVRMGHSKEPPRSYRLPAADILMP